MQPEQLQKVVGQNMRRRRQELRLTQEELAERLEAINHPYLSEIENGKRAVTLATVARIAEALEVTPSYLLAGEPMVT